MAIVFRLTPDDVVNAQELGDSPMDRIQFLPGWAPRQDGIWVFSRYAKLRKRRGGSVKVRRYPEYDGTIPNDVIDSDYDLLPARAKCGECGFVNLLAPAALGVNLILRVPATPTKASGVMRYHI